MALSSLIVRIGADVSGLDQGIGKANRHVEQFGKKIQPMGRSLERIGNNAALAAGSLSRLGGVLPGVAGGAAKVVGSIGTAGVVIGETTVLTAGLTKGMRLLQAASTAIAASSAPAWLASLASPAGIAVAGIAALTATVWGLSRAMDALKTKPIRDLLVQEVDVTGRKMPLSAMTGQRAHGLAPVVAGSNGLSDQGTKALSDATVEITLARQAVQAWGDALDGIRPITEALAKQWDLANQSITQALKNTTSFTADAVSELYRMKAALKAVSSATPNFTLSETGKMIRKDIVPQKTFGHGLNPRAFLGDQMDFRPTESKPSSLGDVASAVGTKWMQQSVKALITALNPLTQVFAGLTTVLGPVLETLAPIFQSLGQIIGTMLKPVLQAVSVALSFLAEALGWVIRGIGRLVDALPGISAKGVINAGQAMIDAARAARKNALANDYATEKVKEFAGALSNIPRVLNVNLLRHLATGGSRTGGTGGTGTGTGGTGGTGPLMNVVGGITVIINEASDPIATAEAVGREIDRRLARGGTHRLRAALA